MTMVVEAVRGRLVDGRKAIQIMLFADTILESGSSYALIFFLSIFHVASCESLLAYLIQRFLTKKYSIEPDFSAVESSCAVSKQRLLRLKKNIYILSETKIILV